MLVSSENGIKGVLAHDHASRNVACKYRYEDKQSDARHRFPKRRHQDADPLFLAEREDFRTDLVGGLRRPLLPNVTVGLEVAYTNADSNIALYDYDRVVTALSLSVDF